jgi:DNA-binding SARP family transcriptional activator
VGVVIEGPFAMAFGERRGDDGFLGEMTPKLSVQLLGPLVVRRAGEVVPLPPSRKVRALLAFLALSPHAVTRARLCDLLWDVPNDPRGELRWCLSKLRSVLGEGSGPRVIATGQERVALDLSDGSVDAVEVERAVSAGLTWSVAGAPDSSVCERFAGDFLEGTTVDGSASFRAG